MKNDDANKYYNEDGEELHCKICGRPSEEHICYACREDALAREY